MNIPYAGRSQFLGAREAAIRQHCSELDGRRGVHVNLRYGGGYDGRVIVTIDTEDRTVFGTDWERTDPTQFLARIKAAATALLNCGCEGRFELSHMNGLLTILAL